MLPVQSMILHPFHAHRLECPQSDVQRDLSGLDAARRGCWRGLSGVKCNPAVGAATDPRSRA